MVDETTPFKIDHLTVAYHDHIAVKHASITLYKGSVMAILGPNGAGKSTVIKGSLGLLTPLAGQSFFFGEPLNKVRKRVGYMPQSAEVDWDFPTTVKDVVTMGTYGQIGWFSRPKNRQLEQVEKAMETVAISDLADRQISELSGGQKQRTFMARILAQDPDLYIMDEPFAGVDMASENAIIGVLSRLREEGKTVLLVHHDLGTVKKFCSHVTLMNNGEIKATGSLEEAFTPAIVSETYGFSSEFFTATQGS